MRSISSKNRWNRSHPRDFWAVRSLKISHAIFWQIRPIVPGFRRIWLQFDQIPGRSAEFTKKWHVYFWSCHMMLWWYDETMIWWYDDMMIWWYDDNMIWWYDDMMIWWYDMIIWIIWWYDDMIISWYYGSVFRNSSGPRCSSPVRSGPVFGPRSVRVQGSAEHRLNITCGGCLLYTSDAADD